MFGDVVGKKSGYVDVTLDGMDDEGNVYFVESDGTSHGMSVKSFNKHQREDLVVPSSEIAGGTGIWTTFAFVEGHRNGAAPDVDGLLKRSQKATFRAAVRDQTE